MKKILLYLIYCTTSLFAQNVKFNIYPTDDASERRNEYKLLYNYSRYLIDLNDYKDSVIYISDTNAVIINDEDLYIKQFTGRTIVKILNKKTNQLLVEKDLNFVNRPIILIKYDKTKLKNSHFLSITLVDEKGKICTDNFFPAYVQYAIKDQIGKTITNGTITKLKIKIGDTDLSSAKTIQIKIRLINKQNGLSSMANDLLEDL